MNMITRITAAHDAAADAETRPRSRWRKAAWIALPVVAMAAAWSVIDPIEHAWASSPNKPFEYTPGSWGPQQAMDLIERDGRKWAHSTDTDTAVIACAM